MSSLWMRPLNPSPPMFRGKCRATDRRARGWAPPRMWDEGSREGWHRQRVIDQFISLRRRLTPALRRACAALVVLEEQQRFPLPYGVVWMAVARATKNPRKRALHLAQTLVEKLVDVGVLFWFDRKRQRLDVKQPGIFIALLNPPAPDPRFGD